MVDKRVGLDIDIRAHDHASKQIKSIESSIIRFVGAVSAAVSAVRLVVFPIDKAIELDRELRNVQKTTSFTDKEIKKLSGSFLEMSTRIGASAEELAKIAAIGGQLGLGTRGVDAIEKFTESVARAKVTLDLTEEEAAKLGATVLNIFKIDANQIENVFSAINELSNNSVANASDLGDVIKRVGNVSSLVFPEVAALSAYVQELGVPREQAGTALTKFFSNMSAEGKKFAAVMNVSQEEWISTVRTDAVGALKLVAAQVDKMAPGLKELAIKELFGSGRLYSAANKIVNDAAGGFEKLEFFLEKSNQAFFEGDSAIKEYENILKSTKEQIQLLVNDFNKLAISVGNNVLPILDDAIRRLQEFFKSDDAMEFFIGVGEGLSDFIVGVIDLTQAVIAMELPWGTFKDILLVIIGLKLVKMIAGLAVSLIKSAASIVNVSAAWARARAGVEAYLLALQAVPAAQAKATAGAGAGATGAAGPATGATVAANAAITKELATQGALRKQALRDAAVDLKTVQGKVRALQLVSAQRVAENKQTLTRINYLKAEAGTDQARLAAVTKIEAARKAGLATSAKQLAVAKQRLATELAIAQAAVAGAAIGLKGQRSLSKAVSGAAKQVKGLKGLMSGALKGIGTAIGLAIGGWIGLAITAVYVLGVIFWDEIKSILGFADSELDKKQAEVDKLETKLEKKKERIIKAGEDAKKALDDIVAGEKEVFELSDLLELDQKAMDAKVGGFVKEIEKVSASLVKAKKSAEVQAHGMRDTTADIKAAEKAVYGYNVALRAAGIDIDIAPEGIKDLPADLQEVVRLRNLASKSVEEHTATLEAQTVTYNQLTDSMTAAQERIGFTTWANLATVITTTNVELNKVLVTTDEYRKKLEDVRAEISRMNKEPGSVENLEKLKAAEEKVKEYEGAIKLLNIEQKNLIGTMTVFEGAAAKAQKALTPEGRRALGKEIKKNGHLIDNQATKLNKLAAEADNVSESFAVMEGTMRKADLRLLKAEDNATRATSVYTNMAKKINAAEREATALEDTLVKTIRDRKAKIEFDVDLKKLDKIKDKADEATSAFYDKRIASAQSESRKALLESMKKQSLEQNEYARASKAASLQEEKTRKEIIKSKADAINYLKEAKADLADVEDPERQQKAEANRKKSEEALDDYKKKLGELSKFTDVNKFTGKITPVLDEAEAKELADAYKKLEKKLQSEQLEVAAGIKEGALDELKEAKAEHELVTAQYAEQKQSLANITLYLTNMPKIVQLARKEVELLTAEYANAEAKAKGLAEAAVVGAEKDKLIQEGLVGAQEKSATKQVEATVATEKVRQESEATELTDEERNKSNEEMLAAAREHEVVVAATAKVDKVEVDPDAPIPETEVLGKIVYTLTDKEGGEKTTRDRDEAESAAKSGLTVSVQGVPIFAQETADAAAAGLEPVKLGAILQIQKIEGLPPGAVLPGGEPAAVTAARGGYIKGAGTATSDSIRAWLSNGEYVMDAFTTKLFGSNFFSGLQALARSGRSKQSAMIPKFATGGPVNIPSGSSQGGLLSQVLSSMSGPALAPVNLTIAGETYQVQADKDNIDSLTTHMRRQALMHGKRRKKR